MSEPRVIGVIPARLGSTRLTEKVLRPIQGRPMIEWVWRRAAQARLLSEVIVACDDPRIESAVRAFGGRALMTRADHPNGTSRVAEVASAVPASILINIQGDEPLMDPSVIDQLAQALLEQPDVPVATLAVRKQDPADYENPNVVKVVTDLRGRALYFSRSPLPFYREAPPEGISYLKHLGIYGYRREFLLEFVKWKSGVLEAAEKLEQLHILERGYPLLVLETRRDSPSVDTAEDLEVVEKRLRCEGPEAGMH